MACNNNKTQNSSECNEIILHFSDFDISIVTVIGITLILDISSIITIIRTQLIKTEFLILLSNNVFSFIFKLIGVVKSLNKTGKLDSIGIWNCLISFSLNNDIFFAIFIIYFYYSLFHFSTVSRSGCLRRIFTFTHNKNVFLAYLASLFVSYTIYVFIYSIEFQVQLFVSNNKFNCDRPNLNLYHVIPPISIAILFPTPIVYLIAIIYLLILRIYESKNSTSVKLFRKKFIILIKFFVFSVVIFFISVPQYLYPFLNYFFLKPNSVLKFASDILFLVFFSIQTMFLVLIHNKLRKSFIIIFINPFKRLFYRIF